MGEVQSNQVEPSIWREWRERVVRRGEEREREREVELPMREESSLIQLWLMLTRVRLSTRYTDSGTAEDTRDVQTAAFMHDCLTFKFVTDFKNTLSHQMLGG